MLKLSGKKKWLKSDEVMQDYEDYLICHYGVHKVRTEDIIALGLWPPEDIAADEKMKILMESVRLNGWNDPGPRDLHLNKLPTGKYAVCTGGNHRPVLATELGIEEIFAYIDVVMPKDKIDSKVLKEYHLLDKLESELNENAVNLSKFLQSKGIKRDEYPEEKLYQEFCDRADKCFQLKNELLKNEAIRLNFINDSKSPKINIRYTCK